MSYFPVGASSGNGAPFTPPVAAAFSFVNQGGATLVNNTTSLCLKAPQNGNSHQSRLLVQSAPATPYTITAYIKGTAYYAGDDRFGILFRNSGSGKFEALLYGAAGTNSPGELRVTYYSDPATPVSVAFNITTMDRYPWLQISDDGTNRIYRISTDGFNFVPVYTEVRNVNFTADQVGWFADPTTLSGPALDSYVTLFSWAQS